MTWRVILFTNWLLYLLLDSHEQKLIIFHSFHLFETFTSFRNPNFLYGRNKETSYLLPYFLFLSLSYLYIYFFSHFFSYQILFLYFFNSFIFCINIWIIISFNQISFYYYHFLSDFISISFILILHTYLFNQNNFFDIFT